jgi:eukaryotic-like serine/threonine-protein kinase
MHSSSASSLSVSSKLSEDILARARYQAASAAALAGCGQAKEADQLHDEDRTLRHRRALDWLRQDLTWCGKQLDGGKAQANAWVRFSLVDPDLAGVRAKDALARLPKEERERWERLWSDLDTLRRRLSLLELSADQEHYLQPAVLTNTATERGSTR